MKAPIHIDIPAYLPNHPWHPSVIYTADGFAGHRWRMAETPYPPFHVDPYRDRWELPCIHYSDDGVHWKSAGAPIDDLTEEQIANHSYHSDPHLVMKDEELYCYYRLMEDHDSRTTIIRKQSTDGIHWSKREIIELKIEDWRLKNEVISPAIVWTGKKWRMYYVDDTYKNQERGIQMAESDDGVHFTHVCSAWEPQAVKPWHIDVQLIDGRYYLLVHDVDHKSLTLYTSADGMQWEGGAPLLKASKRFFDYWSNQLYRACLVSVGDKKYVYFSANDASASYIGLMQCDKQGKYRVADGMSGMEKVAFAMQFLLRRISLYYHRYIKRKL